MNTQSTEEIFKSKNKTIEQRIIEECRELPIITKHFTTLNDDAYKEPIVNLSDDQKAIFKNLTNEI